MLERMTHNTYPISDREKRNALLAKEAATQSMVLLKNENKALPLAEESTIAMFGVGAVRTVRGGTGSGDPFNGGLSGGGDLDVDQSTRYHIQILDSMVNHGMNVLNADALREVGAAYDTAKKQQKDHVMSVFAFPEPELSAETLAGLAAQTDTAVYVLSRNAGEGNDRSMTKLDPVTNLPTGDYQLTEVERANLDLIRRTFPKMVLVLNVGGQVQMDELLAVEPDAILLMGQAGQEGGDALYEVITGAVNPSGKLTNTWAFRYEDHPTAATFANNDGNVDTEKYEEGIYVGYRYFDSYDVAPAFPFGYGLSYTTFQVDGVKTELEGNDVVVSAVVTNTGDVAGREVVQLYVSAPEQELDMPYQELKGFAKTALLQPGESQTVSIKAPLRTLASFHTDKEAYVLSDGDYWLRVGTSSRNTAPACVLQIPQTFVTEQVYTQLPLAEELEVLTGGNKRDLPECWQNVPVLVYEGTLETIDSRSPYQDQKVTTYTTDPNYQPVMPYEVVELVEKKNLTLLDVEAGKGTMEEFIAQLTVEQLSVLNCGSGWGVQDEKNPVIGANSESVPGAAGETTNTLPEFGIPSMVMADGPGGLRVTQIFEAKDAETGEPRMGYHFCTAWPVGSLLAQSYDMELLERVGVGFAEEMKELRIGLVLGPGINIHRDPLGGRNFEYFSEDPLVAGACTVALVKGIQSIPGAGACVKHYAANNQETNRNAQDSVVDQRTLREIYLKPFEIAVKESQPLSIMTSYNKINSVPSADSFDLNTNLARGEWGYQGHIMTDWNGGSSTPWISMHAGNDLIMPGGPARVMNILMAAKTVMPQFDERGQVLMGVEPPFVMLAHPRWYSYQLDPAGEDLIEAPIAPGHTTEVKDGVLLVDGEPLFTKAGTIRDLMRDRENFQKVYEPATTAVAQFSEDGTKVIYRGNLEKQPRICLGDIQRCAMNNLKVIMQTFAMDSVRK